MQTKGGLKAKYERLFSNGLMYIAKGESALGEKYLNEAALQFKEYILTLGGDERTEGKEWFLELCGHIKDIRNQKLPERGEARANYENEGAGESLALSKADVPNVSFDDVIGLEKVKEQINDMIIYPKRYKELYELFKKKSGGGILLYGPPGNGKTMIAKAIAKETDSVFYAVKFSDLASKWFGETEGKIKALFEEARNAKSAVIFFDEIDAIASKRQESSPIDRAVCELLTQIDGINKPGGSLTILAATNRPEVLDPAILRPGRFDEKIYIPLPESKARQRMLERKLDGVPCSIEDFSELADLCSGFSGAEIELACEKAKQSVIRRIIKEKTDGARISREDLIKAINSIKIA